jgi:hypothetical protein
MAAKNDEVKEKREKVEAKGEFEKWKWNKAR